MGHAKNPGMKKSVYKQNMKANRKQNKVNSQEKRARLIIKNLSFKSTEENLRAHYEQYGKVKEVKLLKRPDGKLVGCGFVQFDAVQCASKAKYHTHAKEFLGREIQCEFAISKDRFVKKLNQEKFNKNKNESVDVNLIKEEVVVKEEGSENNDEIKEAPELSEISEVNDDNLENDEDSEGGSDDGENVSDCELDKDGDTKSEIIDTNEPRKPHVLSNDVDEGKTIFIKNLPFDANNDDLKQCMRQFGTVYYALVCMDRATEHSKGTGFVKFVNKEDADKCLAAGTELTLLGNILDVHPALNKNDITRKSTENEKDKHKDSRNLYLIKEGVILAGTKAAEGLSSSDMAKRLQLEQYKTQMLRNLNMFISRNRLIAHNLPPTWDDAKFKELFMKHAGPKAFIKEAKIMRDMKQVDSKGMGVSKEFGFITFTTHEHALNTLRALNNNPMIFSATKRPIVAFSIENRVMINTKQKRMERSRIRNPLSKDYDSKALNHNETNKTNNKFGNNPNNNKPGNNTNNSNNNNKFGNNPNNNKFGNNTNNSNNNNKFGNNKFDNKNKFGNKRKFEETSTINTVANKFTGVEASPGIKKMRSRYNLKTQASMHHETIKSEKKKKMLVKKTLQERKKDFIRQPQQKIGKGKNQDDNFSKMVNAYKDRLLGAAASSNPKQNNKGKWFEEAA